MQRRRMTGIFVLALLFAGCGREAESRGGAPAPPDVRAALEALRVEVRALRGALQGQDRPAAGRSESAVGLAASSGTLQVELVDAGLKDPFLHARAPEMLAIAAGWGHRDQREARDRHLAELVRRGHAAVPGLIPFLRDTPSDTRLAVLFVLRELGVAAEAAVPHIQERRRDPDAAVRAAADDALCAIHFMPRSGAPLR